jgi:tetratricopeptide (TPR) repeat protein
VARRAKLAILAAAAGVAIAVVLGGFGWLKTSGERAERARALEARVSEAIRRAGALEARGKLGPAAEAAQAAVGLAADAGEEVRRRAAELAARIERERAEAEAAEERRLREEETARRLEAARLARLGAVIEAPESGGAGTHPTVQYTNDQAAEEGFAAAFRDHGIDVLTLDVPEAAARIAASGIRVELVAALDEWAWIRRWKPALEGTDWRRLHEVARLADPGDLENELREAIVERDREALLGLVDRVLATTSDPRALDRLGNAPHGSRLGDPPGEGAQRGRGPGARGGAPAESAGRLDPDAPRERLRQPGPLGRGRPLPRDAGEAPAGRRAGLDAARLRAGADRRAWARAPCHRPGPRARAAPLPGLHPQGGIHSRLRQLDEALLTVRKAREIAPEVQTAHMHEGWYRWLQRDFAGAETCFRRATKVKHSHAFSRWYLAWFLAARHRDEAALEQYRIALAELPGNPNLLIGMADLLNWMGRPEEALSVLDDLLSWYPEGTGVRLRHASALLAVGDLDRAEEELRPLLEEFPENRDAHIMLGSILTHREDHRGALEEIRRAIRADPGVVSYSARAGMMWLRGRIREATVDYEECERLDDTNTQMLLNLAHCYHLLGEEEKSQARLRRVGELDPDYPLLHSRLASLLWGRGEVEPGLAMCDKGIAVDPRWPVLHINRGKFLMAKGRFGEAAAAIRRAIEVNDGLSRTDGRRHAGGYGAEGLLELAEAVLPLEGRMDEIADGSLPPKDNAERLRFAEVCAITGRFPAVFRLYRQAFAEEPAALLRDSNHEWAVVAGLKLGNREGRDQALAWIRAWMESLEAKLADADLETRVDARLDIWSMRSWARLAPIRDDLDSLPEEEREPWRTFWRDLDALLDRDLAKEDW